MTKDEKRDRSVRKKWAKSVLMEKAETETPEIAKAITHMCKPLPNDLRKSMRAVARDVLWEFAKSQDETTKEAIQIICGKPKKKQQRRGHMDLYELTKILEKEGEISEDDAWHIFELGTLDFSRVRRRLEKLNPKMSIVRDYENRKYCAYFE